MAYARNGTGPWAWLKSVGSQDHPLEPDWTVERDHLMQDVRFPKHPRSIREGDILVYYAAHHGVLPAIVRVRSDRVEPAADPRWKWSMDVRPLVTLPLRDAPTIYDSPIDPLRVRRQSQIRLSKEEFEEIRKLIFARAQALSNVE